MRSWCTRREPRKSFMEDFPLVRGLAWRQRVTASGLWNCCTVWDMSCGWEMLRRFVPAIRGNRSTTSETRGCCCSCWWRNAFRGPGCPHGNRKICGGTPRSGISQRVFASLPQQGEGSGESGGGKEVGDSTVLNAAHHDQVSRDRSYREQLAGAPGRPPRRIDRRVDWALSSRFRTPGFG